jgi:hypothetical protein
MRTRLQRWQPQLSNDLDGQEGVAPIVPQGDEAVFQIEPPGRVVQGMNLDGTHANVPRNMWAEEYLS